MYHTFFPNDAFVFENVCETFTLPPEELCKRILDTTPKMKIIFDQYRDNPQLISTQEIYPGKSVLSLKDIPEKVRAKGGVGLMIGVAGNQGGIWDRVVSILKMGALSTQDRYQMGFLVSGASSSTDYNSGGGECVFTRMITKETIAQKIPIDSFEFHGGAQVLFDLDVLERGGYAYSFDSYGRKNRFAGPQDLYKDRKSIIDFTEEMNSKETHRQSNEVMVKNRIAPTFIRCIVVGSENEKKSLIEQLRRAKIVQTGPQGEVFNGKPLDKFIQVAKEFKDEMWNKKG